MTPPLSHPDEYLQQLIAMSSSEAKRLWRRAIKEYFGKTCVYCGATYELQQLTLDHVHPKALGGDSNTNNLVPACKCCNHSKGTRNWKDWMRENIGLYPIREHLIEQHIN